MHNSRVELYCSILGNGYGIMVSILDVLIFLDFNVLLTSFLLESGLLSVKNNLTRPTVWLKAG